jgi:hypothetical protein
MFVVGVLVVGLWVSSCVYVFVSSRVAVLLGRSAGMSVGVGGTIGM